MSNKPPRLNGDAEALLQSVMATPVGRRWLLKAGLGSAAAVAAAHLPSLSRSASANGWAAGFNHASAGPATSAAATGASQPSPTSNRTLQFALSPATAGANGVSSLTLVANGVRAPLVAHTAASRAALQAQGGVFAAANLNALTHHVQDVPLPSDRGMLVSVYGTRGSDQVVVSQMWHAPEATTLGMAQLAAGSGNGLRSMLGSDERLRTLGLSAEQVSIPQHVVQLDSVGDTQSTAVAMAMLHPNVATTDPTSVTATKSVLGQTPEIGTLGTYIGTLQSQGKDFAKPVPITDANGSATQFQFKDANGNVTKAFTSTTIQLNPSGDGNFASTLQAGVSAGVKTVRNTSGLGQVIDKPISDYPVGTPIKTWVQSQGVNPQPTAYTPPTPSPAALGSSGSVDINIANTGLLYGTYTKSTGGINSSRQVPIRIYNNYVRWIWAYVQYIGTDSNGNDVNLSANPSPKWPDTKYSQSLTIVPQVFTVLGIPLWDTNTVDVTLTFPPDAHTARLLYCGLGNDVYGGDWRQYFPSDAYPDRIAPTDEVLFPALVTGLLTIGVTFFALIADIGLAVVWNTIRKLAASDPGGDAVVEQVNAAIQAIAASTTTLTVTESAAMAVGSGGATYVDIANRGENANNLWDILLAFGTIIPKVLFSPATAPFFAEVALAILSEDAAEKLVDAIPIIGEAMAIVQAVGDAATLAEVAGETATSPWVIENEVSLTYTANLTINYDEAEASGWPATASAWTLQPQIDGADAQKATTGPMNVGGRVGSDPLNLTVTTPFGGDSIQWSFVVLDQYGHQVGTGLSPKFTNNDPNNPPTTVSFNITELPETVDASTTFERADTFLYSSSAGTSGGYTWSNASGVIETANAAVPSSASAIQAVTGATVATKAGVVGLVWKQNDRYFLQGIPVDQNADTLDLVAPTKNGYARPPFLLFDAFVAPHDQGNHVLLEPDDTSDAYFVRSVSLDSTTGAITWDTTAPALGTFLLPVSAAALHSSGRVITVHTDSGRVGMVHPAATPRPGLAAYSAGPGTQIGLLQSPTAVAVTNPGTVIILEAGASQLAAFDLNGNPIQYFGTDPNNLQYTQPLANPGTYLDLAVDGANHLYLLYSTNDGSQPGDYHLDVYNPNGTPLTTLSTGINAPKLAVDFWRSVYGVNFTPLNTPSGQVAVPSISRFDPDTPD